GLCELGHEVNLVSNDEVYKDYLLGKPPVFEPGISEGIKLYKESGKLFLSNNPHDPKNGADIVFFAQDVNITPTGVDMDDIQGHFKNIAESGLFKIIVVSSQ